MAELDKLRKLVDLTGFRPLTVVVPADTVPGLFHDLPLTTILIPHHGANEAIPQDLRDLQQAVKEHRAAIGLAFDDDADRCMVIDERGELVSPSVIIALIASRELAREPGATVVHNLVTSRVVPETIAEYGGTPVRTRVGGEFVKAKMTETNAVFGGEHSGHFYFRDFSFADSGMLAALHTLAALGRDDRALSEILADYARYAASGEISSEVADQAAAMQRVKDAYASRPGVTADELDGLTVEDGKSAWWFNLRPSHTGPLLRLNVEAADEAGMSAVRDEVLGLLR